MEFKGNKNEREKNETYVRRKERMKV